MDVYNSRPGLHEDDSDITIIHPSLGEHNDEDNTRVQASQPGTATNNFPSVNESTDYIFVHHDPLENAKKLEVTLVHYIRDLKQESNSQLDCDKQLVIRLIDLIRPAYSNNPSKLADLDRIRDDIGVLHDKRYVQQREKIEELRAEISRLNRMLFTASNDQSIYDDRARSYSVFNSMQMRNSINDYSQWSEIENDAKKLHEIVQSQRNQINEIVTLISQTTTPTSSLEPKTVTDDEGKPTKIDKPSPSSPSGNDLLSTILEKIRGIATRPQQLPHEPEKPESAAASILSNHSPGSSPTHSLYTLTTETLTPSINQPKIEEPVVVPEPQPEPEPEPVPEPAQPIRIENSAPTSPQLAEESKKCPVCNYEFSSMSDDVEMYDHIERCLFPADTFHQPKEYGCPYCERKFPADNEKDYLQHISDCCNNQFE